MKSTDFKDFCKKLTSKSGVYIMRSADDVVIYVGKAINLKNRVSQYFQQSNASIKTQALVANIAKIDIMVTEAQTDALLLEHTLIKKYKPRYNILLRDDKSYPYIALSKHDFPRLDIHRGARNKNVTYFGPYPNGRAVREALALLQRLFKLRSCRDSFFNARSRPCLQYQIKRCSGPCVGKISQEDYARQIKDAQLFLQGRNQDLLNMLESRMNSASENYAYEQAAIFRDQIKHLQHVQETQVVSGQSGDMDALAVSEQAQTFCVLVLYIRAGRVIGSRAHFPLTPTGCDTHSVLSAFIMQYYLNPMRVEQLPKQILTEIALVDKDSLEAALKTASGQNVAIQTRVRTSKAAWLKLAAQNAEVALSGHLSSKQSMYHRFKALQKALKLESMPSRIECFDISHTSGEQTVASCVVFNREGALKSDYRRFNITGITKSDDYAAMHQALTRRYTHLKKGEGVLPDLLLIDGGKGQLTQAEKVLEDLQISGVLILAVAKGPTRKAGLETLILANTRKLIDIRADNQALHLIQQVRDEAHRFAITGHRGMRGKQLKHFTLDDIEGVGPKRRQALIQRFGGLQALKAASVVEIAKVPGISRALAQKIYESFKGG